MKNKIKLFSHTDLDGYGCNVIMKSIFNNLVDCTNANYDKIDSLVKEYILSEDFKNYDCTYITDISVNEEVAELINNKVKQGFEFVLLDHHPTALSLNKYDWCEITIENDGEKTSGTRTLYNNLSEKIEYDLYKQSLFNIVENIKRYDTWLWKDKYNDIKPKQLNDLFYILGSDRFIDIVLKELNCENCEESTGNIIYQYRLLLDLQQEKIDKYVESKNKEIIEYFIGDYKVGIVFAEQFQSELGNKLSEMNPQYDLIAMIGNKTVSYRTVKDDINCGEIAKLFGGGGHPKASGSQIDLDSKMKYIDNIFKK